MTDTVCSFVKVRFKGERRFFFLSGGGRVSRLRAHAAMVWDPDKAQRVADEMVREDPNIDAAAVMRGGRRVYFTGEPTPAAPRPAYGAPGGYRYLHRVTATGTGVFHVRDEDGTWGTFDMDAYEACAAERTRAGLPTDRPLQVHGRIALLSTRGVRFVQESTRA